MAGTGSSIKLPFQNTILCSHKLAAAEISATR
jgi:hypothetical protein